jgi:hypothetical protein
MENVNSLKLVLLLLMVTVGCKQQVVYEVNMYSVGDEIIYDTLGGTTNETLSLINTMNCLMGNGELKYNLYSWTKNRVYGDSLTSYDVLLKKGQDVYDFQVYRLNNRIVLFRNPESTDYRLLKNIKYIGKDYQVIEFFKVLEKIDSIMIPPMPDVDYDKVLEVDSISINLLEISPKDLKTP